MSGEMEDQTTATTFSVTSQRTRIRSAESPVIEWKATKRDSLYSVGKKKRFGCY